MLTILLQKEANASLTVLKNSGSEKTRPNHASTYVHLPKQLLVIPQATCASRLAQMELSPNKMPIEDVSHDAQPTHGATKSQKFA